MPFAPRSRIALNERRLPMLRWAILFLLITAVSGIFGFGLVPYYQLRSGKLAGWLKTLAGTVAGLVSGVVMMYVTGFVNNVVKPAKAVPIFSYDHDNLNVTFHNRSIGGTSGYWDFGDGSPLEPISPKQELVTHTYQSPGDYTAKITLRNLIGEESERSLAVHLDNPSLAPPEIDSLEVVPLRP